MKEEIRTSKAPPAIGPYSQAIRCGSLLFVSGQIAMNSGASTVEGDITEQTHLVLTNLRNVLEAAGSGLDYVLKVTVFMQDINEFAIMNEVYASYFKKCPPARSTVEVAKLPKGARVEIEAIATLDE
jgi:2-iminobutanoate/2-iminopropanoate deaminase